MRAVTTGKLDLTDYDPLNVQHKCRVLWVLQDLENEISAKIVDYRHRHQCAFISSAKISGESWESLQKQAIKSFDELRYFICPWDQPKPNAGAVESSDESIIEAYERRWGKPGTPEHDALIAETNKFLSLSPEQQELHNLRRRMRKNAAV